MLAELLRVAEKNGWRVDRIGTGQVHLVCCKADCPGTATISDGDKQAPEPCDLKHFGPLGAPAYRKYENLVAAMVSRRIGLGLSQEDLNAVIGLAEGHLNKLEAFHRTAEFSTLVHWADALGAQITITPCELPKQTIKAIENRTRPLQTRQPKQLELKT